MSASSTGLLPSNHLLKGKYLIINKLGSGGFASVYKAEEITRSTFVAVKELGFSSLNNGNPPTQQQKKDAIQNFQRESAILTSLNHSSIPKFYDCFEENGRWYLVMDLIEGKTLQDFLAKKGGKISPKEMIDIGDQLCDVLEYLHNCQPPIIFRDLNPENIMITPAGHIYLIDFGISRHFKPGGLYTEPLGTRGYAAPEQYKRNQVITLLSDIYSLGVTFHNMLTGQDPVENTPTLFNFNSPKTYVPSIPVEIDSLIMKMVEADKSC
ncbi:MAG: serine/threonine protein kinase, partial [Bacteroidota bacterium]|nr:serine/threonine protein kinase [Bacteroidota bacterium]